MTKKAVSYFLTFAFLLSLSIFGTPNQSSAAAKSLRPEPDGIEYTEGTLNKYAVPVNGKDDFYDITLEVTGKKQDGGSSH